MSNVFYTNNIESNVLSKTIDKLRFPLTVLVVVLHCSVRRKGMIVNEDLSDIFSILIAYSYNYIYALLNGALAHLAVPTFFFISGYLFFMKGDFSISTYRNKLHKRIKTLFVPYVAWIALYVVSTIIYKVMEDPSFNIMTFFKDNGYLRLFYDCNVWHTQMSLLSGPFLIPLWYIRDLMVMVIISPLIYFLIKRTRHIYIICLTCLFLLRLWPDIHGISLTAIFFFSLGSEFSIRKRNFVVDMYKISNITNILFAVLLAIILMQCLHIYIMDFSVFPLFLVVGVVFLFNLTSSYVRRNISKKNNLSKYSFFMYCAHHVLLIGLSIKIVDKFLIVVENETLKQLLALLITPILLIFICIMLYKVIQRFMPSVLKILTGERS